MKPKKAIYFYRYCISRIMNLWFDQDDPVGEGQRLRYEFITRFGVKPEDYERLILWQLRGRLR